MAVETPIRVRCNVCGMAIEYLIAAPGISSWPFGVQLTMKHPPDGWHIEADYVGCPQHPRRLVETATAALGQILAKAGASKKN